MGLDKMLCFFDTYVFLALDKGSKNYEKFKDVDAITTRFNQAEYGWILIKMGEDTGADNLEPYIHEVDFNIIKAALTIRKKYKKMSMPDAIGYATANYLKIPFVTGDADFKGLPNVIFTKE